MRKAYPGAYDGKERKLGNEGGSLWRFIFEMWSRIGNQIVTKAARLVVLALILAVPAEPVEAEDALDRLMKSCAEHDKKACDELDRLAEKLRVPLDRLNAQADVFQREAKGLGLQTGRRPNLEKAYPIIIDRYMSSDTVEPIHRKRGVDKRLVSICSKSFHDLFFVHGKEIGVLPSGEPDWAEIYLQTIDRYYRFCSRWVQILPGAPDQGKACR